MKVKCINELNCSGLTLDKEYEVLGVVYGSQDYYTVKDDDGQNSRFMPSRFVITEQDEEEYEEEEEEDNFRGDFVNLLLEIRCSIDDFLEKYDS
jgi:hypothetical protein